MKDLRDQLIKLAFEHPEIREDLLSVLQEPRVVSAANDPSYTDVADFARGTYAEAPYLEHVAGHLRKLRNVPEFEAAGRPFVKLHSTHNTMTGMATDLHKLYNEAMSRAVQDMARFNAARRSMEAERKKIVKVLESGLKSLDSRLKENPADRETHNLRLWANSALGVLKDDIDFK